MKKAIEAATNVLAGEDGAVHSYVFQGGLVLSWRGVTSFLIILVCLMIGVFLLASRYYRQWYQVKLNDIRNTPPPLPTSLALSPPPMPMETRSLTASPMARSPMVSPPSLALTAL